MFSFLKKWMGADKPQAKAVPAAPPTRPATPTGMSTGIDPQSAAVALQLIASLGARRPLVGPDGAIAGFEFRVLPSLQKRANATGQVALQHAHARHVLSSAAQATQGGAVGLARLPQHWLLGMEERPAASGMHLALEWSADPMSAAQEQQFAAMLVALRAQGVKVGWDPDGLDNHRPDFIWVQQGKMVIQTVLARARSQADRLGTTSVWVTDVGNIEDLEQALAAGAVCVCGAVGQFRASVVGNDARAGAAPEVLRLGRLMQMLAKGADNAALAGEIKADVGLSFRLLSLLQNARFANLGGATSVESAVQMLGRNELYRWLSVLLMHYARARKASAALREVTLWRARFMELCAVRIGQAPPDELFTLGLASLLGPMLELSAQEVIDALGLPEASQQALLHGAGPYSEYFHLAQQMEQRGAAEGSSDGEHAVPLMVTLGGPSAAQEIGEQAWQWVAGNRLSG